MYTDRFLKFRSECSEKLFGAIDGLLGSADERVAAIGFVTTDDFYGFYLTWGDDSSDIEEFYDWENSLEPEFLYQPLVDAADSSSDLDLLNKCDEKWNYALSLLGVLRNCILQLPDDVFGKNGYSREDIVFFSTMSTGDYIDEMLEVSLKMFNTEETLKAHGLK